MPLLQYKQGCFDIDMCYVTDKIIALSSRPNPQIECFFESIYKNHYKMYNFDYNGTDMIELKQLRDFCIDAKAFLSANERNILVISNGKDKLKTKILISGLICYCGFSSIDAIEYCNEMMQTQAIEMSMMRYLTYLNYELPSQTPLLKLSKIKFSTVPSFDVSHGCNPYFVVSYLNKGSLQPISIKDKTKTYTFYSAKERNITLDLSIPLYGDCKIECYDHDDLKADDYMFSFWVNTCFLGTNLTLIKEDLDGTDKVHYSDNFEIELELELIDVDGERVIKKLF